VYLGRRDEAEDEGAEVAEGSRDPAHHILTTSPLSFPRPAQLAHLRDHAGYPVLVSHWFARLCVTANGYWRFILSYGRANWN
jgi:hypothetical protein